MQWVVTGYMLALAAVIPVTGWAARRVGTRRLYLASLVLFTFGSMLCGLAWSIDSLIVFRVLQGLGGGMLMPTGMIILARAAGPQQMGRIFSTIGIPMILAPVFGPVVGGLLVEHVGWRWIFFVNLPVGIAAVALALRFLPAGHAEEAGPFDWLGLVLLSIGLPTITYGLAEAGSGAGFGSPRALVPITRRPSPHRRLRRPLAAREPPAPQRAPVCQPRFRRRLRDDVLPRGDALRRDDPPPPLLPDRPGRIGRRDRPPTRSPKPRRRLRDAFLGRLTDRFGGGPIALAGVILTAVATLPFAFVDETTPYALIEASLLIRGLGIGFGMMPAMSAAYAVLRPEQIADATPQLTVVQRVGGSIGTAVLAVALSAGLEGQTTASGMADAFSAAYWWALGLTVAAIVPAVILLRAERGARHAHTAEGDRAATEARLEAA